MTDAFDALREREQRYVMQTFKRLPIELHLGRRARVRRRRRPRVSGFSWAGIAVNVLGHAHPAVVEALSGQAMTLLHASNLYYTRPQVDLARRLNEQGFAGRAFFANSGAGGGGGCDEARTQMGPHPLPGAFEKITANGSFHGRTPGDWRPPGRRGTGNRSSPCPTASTRSPSTTSMHSGPRPRTPPWPCCSSRSRVRAGSSRPPRRIPGPSGPAGTRRTCS